MSASPPEVPEGGRSLVPGPDGLLTFRLDGREFGLPITPVVEIVRHRDATPVPRARPAVEGILALRGRMVTIVDLRRPLGLPARRRDSMAHVIVVDIAGDRFGLVVDSALRVTRRRDGVTVLDLDALLRDLS
jgi:purine-binding chemotaxis protein CheW